MKPESPVNTIPPIVILLTLLIVGVELVLQMANQGMIGGPQGVRWRIDAINEYGFSTRVFDMVTSQGNY